MVSRFALFRFCVLSLLHRQIVVVAVLLASSLIVTPCWTSANEISLLKNIKQWQVNTDTPGPKIHLTKTSYGLTINVSSDGNEEDYPKARCVFTEPQDWSAYTRLNFRLRIVCKDPAIYHKKVSFVFYDDKTRLSGPPGSPMKQQLLQLMVPVNQWIETSKWLTGINRSAIRQLDIYLYETPPSKPHHYRLEISKLGFQNTRGSEVLFDNQGFSRNQFKGAVSKPTGSITTQDSLQLEIGSAGEFTCIKVGEYTIGTATQNCPSGLLVRDVTKNNPPIMVGGTIERSGQEIKQTSHLDRLGLTINATFKAHPNYMEIAGNIVDTQGKDRAVTIYLAIPLKYAPWQWWDSVAVSRPVTNDVKEELAYLETDAAYGLNGCHSKYPLGAISLPGQAGLTMAIRMDEPVVHRIAYNPWLRLFYLAIDFGLVPERRINGQPLSEAPFRILIYRHDADWGFRSALQRYYDFFPEFFTKRTTKEGGWFTWGDISKNPGALEAGLTVHWGPKSSQAIKWDNAHGVLALYYFEPQTYQQTMEDFDHKPGVDEVLKRLNKLAQGDANELSQVANQPYKVYPLSPGKTPTERIQATAQVVIKSLNYNSAGEPYCNIGQYGWMKGWGAIMSCNLAPDNPHGKGKLNLQLIRQGVETTDCHYDGIGLDSFGAYGEHAFANYRREHFPYSRFPLSFSALDHKPVQVVAFTTVDWLSVLAKQMHAEGKVLMANCSWGKTPGWLTFAAPYLDIFGAEAPAFADPDFIRAITYRKACTDLPYSPRPAWEVSQHWLHAIHPGYGNDLKALQAVVGLLRDLIAAGWEPITGAKATPAQVRMERFGTKNPIYLVLHNSAQQTTTAEVKLDPSVLGGNKFTASLQPAGKDITINNLSYSLPLAPKETVVIVLHRK